MIHFYNRRTTGHIKSQKVVFHADDSNYNSLNIMDMLITVLARFEISSSTSVHISCQWKSSMNVLVVTTTNSVLW